MKVWNVLWYNPNTKEIEIKNIFEFYSFNNEIQKIYNESTGYSEFEEKLNWLAKSYFWSRCEYEIIATCWPPYVKDNKIQVGSKIDVYDQLRLNWEEFADYVWLNTAEI